MSLKHKQKKLKDNRESISNSIVGIVSLSHGSADNRKIHSVFL